MVPSCTLLLAGLFIGGANAIALEVEHAPNYTRPYVIRRYAPAQAVSVGQQVYRFPVTGPSSGGLFTLLLTSAPASSDLGVLPHIHQAHYENFFALRGRFQLWTEKNGDSEARLLTPGDYGSVPPNTTHTFQLLDPLTEMLGNVVPGGFEDLFFAIADGNYTSSTWSPFAPTNASSGSSSPPASVISSLEQFDVYARLDFQPRRDFVNGTAPATSIWHDGANELASDGRAYFVANNWGPKFLNTEFLGYHIIQPLVSPRQSSNYTFTEGTVTLSRIAANETIPDNTFKAAHAFNVLEGQLNIRIGQEQTVLTDGDVMFVPSNVSFSYWSTVAFTKFFYATGGHTDTLDSKLLANASPWDFAVFPTHQ